LMACVAPLPNVTMVITAATPVTIPSMVKKDRNKLRLTERNANMNTLNNIK
jgi:hypothetical protein